MSSIGIVSSNLHTQLANGLSVNGLQAILGGRDRENDKNGGVSDAARRQGRGREFFADAVSQALASVAGANANGEDGGSAAPSIAQDTRQAIKTFAQDLFAALHASNGQRAAASRGRDADGDNDGTLSAAGAPVNGYRSGQDGLAGRLQGLIERLAASDSTAAAGAGGSSDASLDKLKADFKTLLGAKGLSDNATTLGGFLQKIERNLQKNDPGDILGGVVNTVV